MRHRRVTVLLDLQRTGPALLDRIPQPVKRPDSWVPTPREDQLAGRAAADHLVVDEIRRHADQGQIGEPLTDDLVPCRERNQVCEALERDAVTRAHELRNRLGK